jgi:hypothetical protein
MSFFTASIMKQPFAILLKLMSEFGDLFRCLVLSQLGNSRVHHNVRFLKDGVL